MAMHATLLHAPAQCGRIGAACGCRGGLLCGLGARRERHGKEGWVVPAALPAMAGELRGHCLAEGPGQWLGRLAGSLLPLAALLRLGALGVGVVGQAGHAPGLSLRVLEAGLTQRGTKAERSGQVCVALPLCKPSATPPHHASGHCPVLSPGLPTLQPPTTHLAALSGQDRQSATRQAVHTPESSGPKPSGVQPPASHFVASSRQAPHRLSLHSPQVPAVQCGESAVV